LSSTTDHDRGQALVVFVLSLTTVLLAAALAFDAGDMLVERRTEQNAADAAAMAGARYILDSETQATTAARNLATKNGFTDGLASQWVEVNIPPTEGQWAGFRNAIEVRIGNTRPSLFGGIMGVAGWPVSARAVAAQFDGVGGPWAFLALHETQCEAVKVTGNGNITAYGSIQVNSDCPESALKRQGPGSIVVQTEGAACNVHGGIQDGGGSGELECEQVTGAPIIPDPLEGLPAPAMPGLPTDAWQFAGPSMDVPSNCPGSSDAASLESPGTCQFPSSYAGTEWVLYPGLYPGGIKLQGGTFYLEPGIYWLGGGGLEITGNGTFTYSVDPSTYTVTAPLPGQMDGGADDIELPGGIMFFNTEIENAVVGPVRLNGADANIYLAPLDAPSGTDDALYNGLVLYQDRDYPIGGDDITINGSESGGMAVRGTIYAPTGDVKVNGNDGQLTLDQVIASTFVVNGSPGSQILALNSEDYSLLFYGAGLVE
jgi:hypothetical protein